MNRQIKFRSWNNDRMLYSHNNTINKSNVQNSWFFNTVNEDDIIMQYTGLDDTNKKEIYEGDIIQFKCEDSAEELGYFFITGIVLYNDGSFRVSELDFDYASKGELPMTLEEWLNDSCVIIGNMYETPELHNNPPLD